MSIAEWFDFVRRNWRKEEGQTMAEYGVVLAVITVGAIAAFSLLSTDVSSAITKVAGYLTP
jgi:Flp pilus assembly pilin Flp